MWKGSEYKQFASTCIMRHLLEAMKPLLYFSPFPKTSFWDLPKFKEAADDNWNMAMKGFQDTDCKESIVEKGEIDHFEHFTFFHNVF